MLLQFSYIYLIVYLPCNQPYMHIYTLSNNCFILIYNYLLIFLVLEALKEVVVEVMMVLVQNLLAVLDP